MSIPLFAYSRFLVAPPIQEDESLRGYIVRVAHCNASFAIVRPVLSSLSKVTASIPALSKLTGNSIDILGAHGCSVSDQNAKVRGVRFGNVTISVNQVWLQRRQFCPLCLAADGISRSYWELPIYSVCHKHGIYMIRECSDCKRIFAWDSPSSCACGLHMNKVKTKTARSSPQKNFCKLIAESVKQTIQYGESDQIKKNLHRMISIDWMLLLIEFINNVLIPGFWEEFRSTDRSNFGDSARKRLIVSMLGDRNYRDYLRDALFMHAAKEPMTLVQALRPGNSPQVICQLLGGCIGDTPFHKSIWIFHRSTPMREVHLSGVPIWRRGPIDQWMSNRKFLSRQRISDLGSPTWHPIQPHQFVDNSVGAAQL